MKKQSVLRSVLAALLAASLAVSCGSGATTSSTQSSTQSGGTSSSGDSTQEELFTYDGESAPVVNEPVEFTFLVASSVVDENETLVMQEIQRQWGENVKINWEIKDYSEFNENVGPRLNAGVDLPDLIRVPNGYDSNGIYWKSGVFQDISGYYEEYGYNLKNAYTEYSSVLEILQNDDGTMYYVPEFAMDKDYGVNDMINGKWLDALGLEAPTTTEELYNVLKAFKEGDPNGNGEADEIPLTFSPGYEGHFSTIYGITLVDNYYQTDSGEWDVLWTSDVYKDYLTFMHKLYEEELLDNAWSSRDWDSISSLIANDKVGMTMDYSWAASQVYSVSYPEYTGEEGIWNLMIPVKAPNGKQYYRGIPALGAVYGISRDCEHGDLLFAMMDFLYNEDTVKLTNMGIEGTDWWEAEDGSIEFSDQAMNDQEYIDKLGTNTCCVPFWQHVVAIDPQFAKWHQEENAAVREYIEPALVWYVKDEDQATYEQYSTDLNKYWWEMMAKFIAGEEDLSNWDSYVATCKQMGQDELLQVFKNAQE